jgi:hypothetical protein
MRGDEARRHQPLELRPGIAVKPATHGNARVGRTIATLHGRTKGGGDGKRLGGGGKWIVMIS